MPTPLGPFPTLFPTSYYWATSCSWFLCLFWSTSDVPLLCIIYVIWSTIVIVCWFNNCPRLGVTYRSFGGDTHDASSFPSLVERDPCGPGRYSGTPPPGITRIASLIVYHILSPDTVYRFSYHYHILAQWHCVPNPDSRFYRFWHCLPIDDFHVLTLFLFSSESILFPWIKISRFKFIPR
jgi:hypothetical protein